MKISLVVPIYNSERFLDSCIKSILDQSYQNIELILVDDGSSDKSSLICNKWAENDKRVVFLQKENGGASSARNFGIEKSTGIYIGFIDSDDWVEKNFIEDLLSINNNGDLILSGLQKVNNAGKIKRYRIIENVCNEFENRENLLIETITGIDSGSPCARLYKNAVIKEFKVRFPEEISNNEDSVFNLIFLSHSKTVFILNSWLYNYRVGHPSLSNNYINNWKELANNINNIKRKTLLDCGLLDIPKYKAFFKEGVVNNYITGLIINTNIPNVNIKSCLRESLYYLIEINEILDKNRRTDFFSFKDTRVHYRVFQYIVQMPFFIQRVLLYFIIICRKLLNI